MKKTLLISLACASLIAQETFTLKEQTVTATHLEQDELSYAAPIEIYDEKEIQNSKSKNIYDFLNQETSVISLPSFGNQFAQKLDMRGYGTSNGYQNIVVVVNGRRMNNVDGIPQLLSSIPINSIKKIEILKGSGSVEYGDGANAGVISITTKDFNGLNITAYGGNFDTGYGSFGAGYADELFSFSAFGDYYETDGQRDLIAEDKKDSGRSKNGSFDFKLFPVDPLELRVGWAATRINTNYAGSLSYDEYKQDPTQATSTGYDTNQHFDTDLWSFGLTYELSASLSIDTNLYIEDKTSDYGSSSSQADYDYDSGDVSLKYVQDNFNIVTGVSFFNGQRDGYGSKTSKDNLAGYIKADYSTGKHNLTAGLRIEKVSYQYNPSTGTGLEQDDTLDAYELGYNYKLSNEQSVFASFAHSFQAPDIDRFFATTYPPPLYTPITTFNGFIKPMKANTYNFGYNYFLKNNKFKATVFYIDMSDEIYYTGGFSGVNTNIDETSRLGLELYDKYLILDNLYLSANYTYVDTNIEKDDNTDNVDKTIPGVSKHNLVASVGYAPVAQSKLILSHNYRSSAYAANDFTNSFSQKQEAYNSTDLTASYEINKHFEVFAKVQNLLDEDNGIWIEDDTIYPVNFQRSYYAGLNASF